MVAALFLLVAVIVLRPNTPSGIYQLVALALWIGRYWVEWLFGSATAQEELVGGSDLLASCVLPAPEVSPSSRIHSRTASVSAHALPA
jgi:hypothetical protein